MLTIKELADYVGLSVHQVRRRLTALDDLIADHRRRGENNQVLVDSSGTEMVKRLEDLRKAGSTTDEAVQQIRAELEREGNTQIAKGSEPDHQKGNYDRQQLREAVEGLKSRLERVEKDKQFLQEELQRRDQQIQQLLPAAHEENPLQGKSLWQVIREWFKQPAAG